LEFRNDDTSGLDHSINQCAHTGGDRARGNMKITLNIVGALLVLFGVIWFLQGFNVLPGSFMSGQIKWAVYGGVAVAAGIILLVVVNRRRRNE
jgi:membrane protease YdiL (CAAX protease family)